MIKIMFVCHGNICRSPMAEFVFKKLAEDRGVGDRFAVSSSATSTDEIFDGIGNPVYPPARDELAKHGIGCGGKRAVQLKKSDYEKYDLFVCMDGQNLRNAQKIFGFDPKGKVRKLLDFTERGGDVADPWYTRRFDVAYADIYEGCTALLESIIKNIGI